MSMAELLVGDAAPALQVSEFIKGEPITGFEPSTIYVVEFWATWCGPCRSGIPHLTELQASHPAVRILGVAVQDPDVEKVRDFVREQGDAMGYTVAMDVLPGPEERSGPTHRAWCKAAYQLGIPAAFIVDGEGRIAWIGHPIKLDEPLAAIVEGRWDRAAEAVSHRDRLDREMTRQIAAMWDALGQCNPDDPACAVGVYDEAFARHPELERKYCYWKLRFMVQAAQADALDYARKLIGLLPDKRNYILMEVGLTLTALIGEVSTGGAPVDPSVVAFALDVLGEAAGLDRPDDDDDVRMEIREGLAVAQLAAGRTVEALAQARAARDLAVKADVPPKRLQKLDALVERCSAGSAPASSSMPEAVCEGGVCRIVAA